MKLRLLIVLGAIVLVSCIVPAEQPIESNTAITVPVPPVSQPLVPSEVFSATTLTGSSLNRYLASSVLEIGSESAPNTLTVFTNYDCAYCKEFFTEQYPTIANKFIETKVFKLQIVPTIVKKYESSMAVHTAIHCAGVQNKGYEYHLGLVKMSTFTAENLKKLAATAELDEAAFTICIESEETKNSIERQQSVINRLNVSLIPAFYIESESIIGLPTPIDLEGFMQLNTKLGL